MKNFTKNIAVAGTVGLMSLSLLAGSAFAASGTVSSDKIVGTSSIKNRPISSRKSFSSKKPIISTKETMIKSASSSGVVPHKKKIINKKRSIRTRNNSKSHIAPVSVPVAASTTIR